MLYFIIGTICVTFLWRPFKRWRRERVEAEFVCRSLAPYAGLDVGVEKPVRDPFNLNATVDFLWGATLVVAFLVFCLAIAVRVLH
jgi:hypothetical protein